MKRSITPPRHTGDARPNAHDVHPSCVGLGEAAAPRSIPRPFLFADARRVAFLDRLEVGSPSWARPALLNPFGS